LKLWVWIMQVLMVQEILLLILMKIWSCSI